MNQPESSTDLWHAYEAARARAAGAALVDEATLARLSGLELLRAMVEGTIPGPPISRLLEFFPVEAEPGLTVFLGRPGSEHCNSFGAIHGGFAATVLDASVACAIHTMLPAGRHCTTAELKVNYLRPIASDGGVVRVEGRVIHVGRRTGVAEGRLWNAAGKLCAHATTTCVVFDLASGPSSVGDPA